MPKTITLWACGYCPVDGEYTNKLEAVVRLHETNIHGFEIQRVNLHRGMELVRLLKGSTGIMGASQRVKEWTTELRALGPGVREEATRLVAQEWQPKLKEAKGEGDDSDS